jgi:hypothetical protein
MTSPKDREELKYAHLGNRDTEARRANKEALAEHIASIMEQLDDLKRDQG